MTVSSRKSVSSGHSNSPISLVPAFNGDELALIFGTYLNDAIFVLEWEDGCVVAANARFLALLGREPDAFVDEELRWEDVIHPEDRSVFHTWKDAAGVDFPIYLEESFEVRLVGASRQETPVCITLKHLRWKQGEYLIGFARGIAGQLEQENKLRKEIQEQKDRAMTAIKSSLCVYQFNERIRSTPILTTRLLNVESEEELFREALDVLTSEQGLNYQEATFYTLEDNVLRSVCSTREHLDSEVPLSDDHPLSRLMRKSFKVEDLGDDGIVFPLKSRGRIMGVCEVLPYTRERFFFDESGKVGEWQKDVMLTVGDIIALLLDNLRLTREIKRQSNTDTLTGTYNRHYFVGRLASEIKRAGRYQRPVSMLFIDVDRFKQVNDTFGHLIGDRVLRDLGRVFVENLRETDVVCRYGGDEFVALLPEANDEMALETAQKLLDSVRAHPFVNPDDPDRPIPVSVSIGMKTLSPGENEDDFLKGADDALYQAKQGGRDCLVRQGG